MSKGTFLFAIVLLNYLLLCYAVAEIDLSLENHNNLISGVKKLDTPSCVACNGGTYARAECSKKKCSPGYCPSIDDCAVCSEGTYSSEASEKCISCDPGYYSQENMDNCFRCIAGYYCRSNSYSNATEMIPCDPGFYCPIGSLKELSSTPGYYCDKGKMTSQDLCPAGYYCPRYSTVVPIPCPASSYCVAGSKNPTKCKKLFKSSLSSSSCYPSTAFYLVIVSSVVVSTIIAFALIYSRKLCSKKNDTIESRHLLEPAYTGL